jgi:hypothetical protein
MLGPVCRKEKEKFVSLDSDSKKAANVSKIKVTAK